MLGITNPAQITDKKEIYIYFKEAFRDILASNSWYLFIHLLVHPLIQQLFESYFVSRPSRYYWLERAGNISRRMQQLLRLKELTA